MFCNHFVLYIEAMIMIIYLYIFSKNTIITNKNIIHRYNGAIVVKKDSITNMDFRIFINQ